MPCFPLGAMKTISRRRFLATTALSLAATRLHGQTHPESQVTLNLAGAPTGARMPEDFVGLSYEVKQLTDPTFFSAGNKALVEQFKALSSNGVLRLGGNTSAFGW